MALSESLLEAVIGMATINSLLERDEMSGMELNAADLIMKKGEGKRVAIVGHFPFTPKVRERVVDPELTLRYVRQGASFRQIKKGIRLLTLLKGGRI